MGSRVGVDRDEGVRRARARHQHEPLDPDTLRRRGGRGASVPTRRRPRRPASRPARRTARRRPRCSASDPPGLRHEEVRLAEGGDRALADEVHERLAETDHSSTALMVARSDSPGRSNLRPMDTGFPCSDAQTDFGRARRRPVASRAGPPAAGRARRRQPDPALRRGDRGSRLAQGEAARRCRRSRSTRSSARSIARASSTAASGRHAPREAALAADRRGDPPRARRCRRSTSTGSATCTSCATGIIASRSRGSSAST